MLRPVVWGSTGADEDVVGAVSVVPDQVGGERVEGHGAVGGDRSTVVAAIVIRLDAAGPHAHPLGRAGLPVAKEEISVTVGVTRDEIGRDRFEDDAAAVRRQRQGVAEAAVAIALNAARADANPLDFSGLPVTDEKVPGAVGITVNEVGGARPED